MKNITFLITSVLLFFLLGCEEVKLDVELYGSVKGTVINGETYEPVEGALITTSPASSAIMTNSEGAFEIEKVKVGDLVVTARKKDFLSNTATVAVYEDENTPMTLYMLKDENNIGYVSFYDPVPGNGAVDQTLNITLQWKVDREKHGGDLSYYVYLFESNSTVQKIVGEDLSLEEVVVSNLKNNTTYYWYVVAKYDGDIVANGPTWTFSTVKETD